MKSSTINNWSNLLAWPVRALIVWWIWNTWVGPALKIPQIDYLTALMGLLMVSCFRSSYGYLIGKIVDKLEGE